MCSAGQLTTATRIFFCLFLFWVVVASWLRIRCRQVGKYKSNYTKETKGKEQGAEREEGEEMYFVK